MDIANRLYDKNRMIVLTNRCNLSCGGCNQFCGHFEQKDLWYIALDEFKHYLSLISYTKKIYLFGGEPTLIPYLDLILDICSQYSIHFILQTNGRKGINVPKSINPRNRIEIWTDAKDYKSHVKYLPTGLAPIDVMKSKDKWYYYQLALENCILLKKIECCPTIYKGKAYLCQVAGPLDNLFYSGQYGWEIKNTDPFKKNNDDYEKQAIHFCYRCGWACGRWKTPQYTDEPFLVTPTNKDILETKCLKELENLRTLPKQRFL